MRNLKRFFLMLSTTVLSLGFVYVIDSSAIARSYEECQALAMSHGVPARSSHRVEHRYLRYKAAGTAISPKGLMARCMAGLN